MLVRVVAPHFVAAFVFEDGRVKECAPILRKHVKGLNADQIRALCRRRWGGALRPDQGRSVFDGASRMGPITQSLAAT